MSVVYRKIVQAASVLLGLLWSGVPLTAGDIRDDKSDLLYTNLASQPQFSAVGHTDFFDYCGCTLVAPNWVLTAGHVVNAGTVKIGSGVYNVIDNVPAPGWNGNILDGHDFRLMRIAGNPISDGNAGGVMPLYQGPLLDQVITNVGYGITSNGVLGYSSANNYNNGTGGTRRAGNMMLRSYFLPGNTDINSTSLSRTTTSGVMLSDFISPTTNFSPLLSIINNTFMTAPAQDLEYMLATFDSGSPALINDNGVWKIAGVASFTGFQNNEPGPFGIYGDVSGYSILDEATIQWINDTVAVPEPSTMAFLSLLVCGSAGGGWYHYRRQRQVQELVLRG